MESQILQQETLATQYLNRWERTQQELQECKGYLQTRQREGKVGPQPPGQQGTWLISTAKATAVVNPDVITTAAAAAITVEAAESVRDVGNEGYAQEHSSTINNINNNDNDNDNNNGNGNHVTTPFPPSPVVLSNTEATDTHTLLHQQIQSLQADLHNKEVVCMSHFSSFVSLSEPFCTR